MPIPAEEEVGWACRCLAKVEDEVGWLLAGGIVVVLGHHLRLSTEGPRAI